jgi:hypothetical protein
MGNHAHIIVVTKDATQCSAFHGEVKKQITDAYKRLLDIDYLSFWSENGTSVVRIADLDAAKERIAYLYANPVRANLVDSIDHYPGINSFKSFTSCAQNLSVSHTSWHPWIRSPSIPKLPNRSVTTRQDKALNDAIRARATMSHELILEPNAWMSAYGVGETEVSEINNSIVSTLRSYENVSRLLRAQNGWKLKGATRLALEPVNLTYCPAKDSCKIFIHVSKAEERKRLIAEYKYFCERCNYCYEQWKIGDYSVDWPPGAFQPPIPPRANWFEG